MQQARYVRLYTDEAGESHFEDVEMRLEAADFAPPAQPMNVAAFLNASHTLWVGAPVGWSGEEPHPTPQRQLFCIVQGEFEVTTSDGDVRRLPVGSVIVLEDTWGKGHSTRILGDQAALMLGVVLER